MALHTASKTVQNVATDVRRTFGDEASVQVTDADIIRWTNSAQQEINLANKVLRAAATADVTGGDSTYTLDPLKIVSIVSIHYNGAKLEARTFQDAEEYIMKNDPQKLVSSDPVLWYEWAGIINLYPVPQADAPQSLIIYYIAEPPTLASLSDPLVVPDTYYENVLQFVLSKAYELDEDSPQASYKLGQFSSRLTELADQEDANQLATYPRITILEEDM
jgi:hypothetical protein